MSTFTPNANRMLKSRATELYSKPIQTIPDLILLNKEHPLFSATNVVLNDHDPASYPDYKHKHNCSF